MSTTIGLSFNIKLLSQKVWSLILETACRTLDLHDSWTIDVTASSLFLSCLLPHLYGSRTKCNDAERSIDNNRCTVWFHPSLVRTRQRHVSPLPFTRSSCTSIFICAPTSCYLFFPLRGDFTVQLRDKNDGRWKQ